MGLDWLAGNKAKPGHEERFRELLARIVAGEEFDDATLAEWEAIGVPAYTTVGAPRVGIDQAATDWFLKRLREQNPKSGLLRRVMERRGPDGLTTDERAAVERERGYYVLELAPAGAGLPRYTHGGMYDGVDLTSFRGAFLNDCEEVIGKELLESAWERKLPEDLVTYGQALMARANAWAAAHGCEEIREQDAVPEDGKSPEALAHIVFAAARWCIYWGERGHWLDVWF